MVVQAVSACLVTISPSLDNGRKRMITYLAVGTRGTMDGQQDFFL